MDVFPNWRPDQYWYSLTGTHWHMGRPLILAVGKPSQALFNLHSLLDEKRLVPICAKSIEDKTLLPKPVRTMLSPIKQSGGSWMAWQHEGALWFYACWITLLERGRSRRVVLRVRRYGSSGHLVESSEWIRKSGHPWNKLDIR